MATYFTGDFSGFSIGSTWTRRWDTPATDWSVSSGELLVDDVSTNTNFCGVSWDSVGDDDDVDVLVKFSGGNVVNRYYPIFVRGSGSAGSPTCYAVSVNSAGLRIYYFNASETGTSLGSTTSSIANNTYYFLRLRVNSDDLTATIWATDGSESSPIATLTITNDTSISGSGWLGPLHYQTNGTSSKYDQYGVGTNGDTAPSSATTTTTVAPGKAALTVTGKAPTLAQTAHQTVSPGKAAATFTGRQPVVTQTATTTVSPGKAAITAAGKQPTLAQTAHQWVAPGKAALTVAGYAPVLTQGVTTAIAPAKGAITYTGKAPTLAQTTHQTLAPDVGHVTHTGRQPVVVRSDHQAVSPGKAAVTVAGKQPSITQGATQTVAPGKGAVVCTGRQPVVTRGEHNFVDPGKGAAVVTGHAPAIVASGHQTILPGKGAMLFTGYRPGIIGRVAITRTPVSRIVYIGAADRAVVIGAPARTVYVQED